MRLIDADKIAKWYSETHTMSFENIINLLFLQEIAKCMPSEDAKPVVHAHWNISHCDCGIFHTCSKCGTGSKSITEYCPKCGAKMDERRKK